ncbi:MAG: SU10 major capsid protein [Hyphomicrobiaceae bacterium]
MAVKGVFASNQNIQGTRKGDFASALLQTQPTGSAPLLALSSGMRTAGAGDVVITWFEENHLAGRVNITNNAGTGTSLVVDDASHIVAGQFFNIEESGEYVFVDSVAGTTLTVTRGFGGSTVAAVDGSATPKPIQRIGTSHEEGSARPTAVANIGFPRFNYMQIFRNAWDVTGTARAVQYHTGDIVAKNKSDASLFHAEDIERSCIWGRKSIGTLNGKPFRTMDGIRFQLSTNVVAQGADTTWAEIDAWLQSIFEVNIKGQPNERISFAGNEVIRVLNEIADINASLEMPIGETEFGLKIRKWMTPYGDVVLMTHPLFVENPLYTKDWLVLHPAAYRARYLRNTSLDDYDRDGTRAGADSDFGVITTEKSIEYMAERTGGYFSGIDTAAANA